MKTKSTLGLIVAIALLVLNSRSHSQDDLESERVSAQRGDAIYDTFGIRTENSLVAQYVELSSQLANRMTDEELESAIVEMTQELDSRNAAEKIKSVRDSLQEIIDSHPDTPEAADARRALQSFEPLEEFGGTGSEP